MTTPPGFSAHGGPGGVLLAHDARWPALREAGLADPEAWRLPEERGVAGRGGIARLALPDGTRIVIKRMRRGGLTAGLWRDRFPGTARLVANVTVPIEAERRGVPTARPVALLLRRHGLGLWSGWLACEELSETVDLLTRLRETPPPDEVQMARVLAVVRAMHDAGVEHRDLNLGNLLVRPGAAVAWEAFVVDLDRARLHSGPLAPAVRRAGLRRLERSYAKNFGERGPLAGRQRDWRRVYAGGDRELLRALEAGRRTDRARLALHRLGWRSRNRGATPPGR